MIALIGARTRERLAEALGALAIELGEGEAEELERAMPAEQAAGERYPAPQMRMLDSER